MRAPEIGENMEIIELAGWGAKPLDHVRPGCVLLNQFARVDFPLIMELLSRLSDRDDHAASR
jgi:hypothetical protein